MKINENQKVTLTLGQLKKLITEAKEVKEGEEDRVQGLCNFAYRLTHDMRAMMGLTVTRRNPFEITYSSSKNYVKIKTDSSDWRRFIGKNIDEVVKTIEETAVVPKVVDIVKCPKGWIIQF